MNRDRPHDISFFLKFGSLNTYNVKPHQLLCAFQRKILIHFLYLQRKMCLAQSAELVSGTQNYSISIIQYHFLSCKPLGMAGQNSRPIESKHISTHLHRNYIEKGVQSQGTQEL